MFNRLLLPYCISVLHRLLFPYANSFSMLRSKSSFTRNTDLPGNVGSFPVVVVFDLFLLFEVAALHAMREATADADVTSSAIGSRPVDSFDRPRSEVSRLADVEDLLGPLTEARPVSTRVEHPRIAAPVTQGHNLSDAGSCVLKGIHTADSEGVRAPPRVLQISDPAYAPEIGDELLSLHLALHNQRLCQERLSTPASSSGRARSSLS